MFVEESQRKRGRINKGEESYFTLDVKRVVSITTNLPNLPVTRVYLDSPREI